MGLFRCSMHKDASENGGYGFFFPRVPMGGGGRGAGRAWKNIFQFLSSPWNSNFHQLITGRKVALPAFRRDNYNMPEEDANAQPQYFFSRLKYK